jgi:hypothetical protein
MVNLTEPEQFWKSYRYTTEWTNIRFDICLRELKCFMKNSVFWHLTLCGSCKSRHFGGKYRIHQGRIGELGTCHPDDGRDTFHRNLGTYKSHTA